MDEYLDCLDEGRGFPAFEWKSPAEVMMAGLRLVYSEKRIFNVRGPVLASKTNEQRFKDHYGANPVVVAHIWGDLQTTNIPKARIKWLKFDMFLMALNFNYRYHRESEREAQFDRSPKTLRKWTWYYLIKVQLLQKQKIVFPEPESFGNTDIIMSVDGVHSLFHEIAHHELSQNREYYSHKLNHAGLCYELGIHLYEPKLIWINGSFAAGPNDKSNFIREHGLRDKLASIGKKALGDKGYTGYSDQCSTFNAFDHPAVKAFKSRAQMRHEQFNGMLKEFSSLVDLFRHEQDKFEVCFESACVICQYRMEHGEPLFDVLAGIQVVE